MEGADARYRSLTLATMVRDAIRKRLAGPQGDRHRHASQCDTTGAGSGAGLGEDARRRLRSKQPTILSRLDMSQRVDRTRYETGLEELQGRLNALHRKAQRRGTSAILVFEGSDAAGKGRGDPPPHFRARRPDQVITVAAPNDEERAHPYLWRFWRKLPRGDGGDLRPQLVRPRARGARRGLRGSAEQWIRAYGEINDFEAQLVDHGIVVIKFWMHITADEQLRRFREREKASYKRWKLTDEDWRNRKQWEAYQQAVNDMVERTSTRQAPWTLVAANDKNFARLKVLTTVCDGLEGHFASH